MTDLNEVEILLVEDNPYDVELTLTALKENNLTNKVHVLNDGAEALEFVFATGAHAQRNIKNIPKVMLLDLKLPKVNGLEVLRKMKSDERTKKIPVVILTSSQEERDVMESYNLGVNSYIIKPIDFNKFIDAVAKLSLYWVLLNRPPH
ncbi:MAG: response regulator [Candidatus Methanoperedens sp.]|nr:response regulator [Candidatus Methanoperedens sp.]MCZ7360362.1 response regulator [Candidatus Methanoperedens sp.]HLB70393.1 response regulator [Candidatus Methanoperedens sp.]